MTTKRIQPSMDQSGELTPLDATRLSTSDVPTRVRIAPWGRVESASGAFIVDEESARLVTESFDAQGTDLPIDYEHQTLGGAYASPTGQAPAAGWIKRIEAEPGVGLFAHVEWTAPALEQLAAKQYRYLSPVALIRKTDRKLVGLHSVALTNKPAIVGAMPIVNRKVSDVDTPLTSSLRSLRERLSLDSESDVETILVAASRRFEDLEKRQARGEAEARVSEAILAGKLTEAQREVAMLLALRDSDLFDQWLRAAPVVVPLGRTVPPGGTSVSGSRHALEARARSEFRAHSTLAALTSEEAYVADAVRAHVAETGI